MKIAEEARDIISNISAKDSVNFSIDQNSSIIFSILRDKMYANPVDSICREIISNGIDAHKKVGKENVPLEVWMPNNGYVIFRDFGVGMSPEVIRNVYSVYGASTKRDSNEEIGGFGLGAKIPFSIVDSFFLITNWEGIEYTYVVYIDASGKGIINLAKQEEKEDCGTTVKIPVSPEHKQSFVNAILKYAKFLVPQPKIVGNSSPIPPRSLILEGNGWKIYSKTGGYNEPNILYNNIPYTHSNYNYMIEGVTYVFGIGDIEVDATRANIRNTEKTNAALALAKKNYDNEIKNKVQEKLDSEEDFINIINFINQFGNKTIQTSYNHKNGSFVYPFPQPALKVRKESYSTRLRYNSVSYLESPQKNSFILRSDKIDKNGNITPYHVRKIKHYMETNNLHHVYVVKDCHQIPQELLTKLDDIKLTAPNRSVGGNKGRVYVTGKILGALSKERIDRNQYDKIVYTDDLTLLEAKYPKYQSLPRPIILLNAKDIKLVDSKPNWYTIEDYVKEITGNLTIPEIKEMYKRWYYSSSMYFASAVKRNKHLLPKEYAEVFEGTKSQDDIELARFYYDNGLLGKVKIMDLYGDYPLLKYLDYNVTTELVRHYIDLVNSHKPKEQTYEG